MKMKCLLCLMLISLPLIFFTGCKNKKTECSIKYVTSCYPVHIIAMNLVDGVDDVEVKKMSETHSGCLHDFQLQSSDLKNIENSSAFIINGAEMETFLEKIKEENANISIIDSSQNIALISDEEDDDCDEEMHYHSDVNPHIWMSPENYIIQINNIADGLKAVDPKNAEKYQENADIYINKISDLKIKMHKELEPFANKDMITFHNAFPYFAKEFGLNVLGVMSHEPGEEPSAKEILDIVNLVKNNGVNAIFIEPQYPDSVAKTISKETGAEIYTLNPIVSGENSKNAYIDAMEKNLEILKIAFGQ